MKDSARLTIKLTRASSTSACVALSAEQARGAAILPLARDIPSSRRRCPKSASSTPPSVTPRSSVPASCCASRRRPAGHRGETPGDRAAQHPARIEQRLESYSSPSRSSSPEMSTRLRAARLRLIAKARGVFRPEASIHPIRTMRWDQWRESIGLEVSGSRGAPPRPEEGERKQSWR